MIDTSLAEVDRVVRQSYGKLVAYLSSGTGDVAAAEDALADALVAALKDWPTKGCPTNPEGWLLTAARRRLIDGIRRRQRGEVLLSEIPEKEEPDDIPDRRLALMFVCAHPAIEPNIRAPLILQTILGLNAKMIASAFLTSPEAMGKRLVRAKEKIRLAGIPFRVPEREELPERLEAVLTAIYAAFAEGWTDPGGSDVTRRELAEEAIYLSRLVVELMPEEPEALGLLALILHLEARRLARRGSDGEYVPLAQQNSNLWDMGMIIEAESLLRKASGLGSFGRFQIEAALQSAHVFRCRTGQANWPDILRLYDALLALDGSPVVAINRALAVAEVYGSEAALAAMPAPLAGYQPYWAAQAELLSRTGAKAEAHHAYEMAIGLERDPVVRRFLQERQLRLKLTPQSFE